MHGLGNDFVVFDTRQLGAPAQLSNAELQHIANRTNGIGCDQILVLKKPLKGDTSTSAAIDIYNADGSKAMTCGNGLRCVGGWLCEQQGLESVTLGTASGNVTIKRHNDGVATVTMGIPSLALKDKYIKVDMGNPHIVVFDVATELSTLGPILEKEYDVNVEKVTILDSHTIHIEIWERGVGFTKACGSGACAAAYAAHKHKNIQWPCRVEMPGGSLEIAQDKQGNMLMTGPYVVSFDGSIELHNDSK